MLLILYVIIGLAFFTGGLVKGVVGLGLPTVSLALLAVTLGVKPAIALLVVPALVTNVYQAISGGALAAIVARLWPMLAAICVGAWVGAGLLVGADAGLLSALLGVLVCLYAVISLMRPRVAAVGAGHEIWLSPMVGAVNGVLTGLTGTFVFPAMLYLPALGLARDALIQAMGVTFMVSSAALGLALVAAGIDAAPEARVMTQDLALASAIAVVPALAGQVVGRKVRARLSEAAFLKALYLALLLLGAYLAGRYLILLP